MELWEIDQLRRGEAHEAFRRTLMDKKCESCQSFNPCPCGGHGWCEELMGFVEPDACPLDYDCEVYEPDLETMHEEGV